MRGCSHLSSYDVEIEWQTGVEADLGMLSMSMPKSVFSKFKISKTCGFMMDEKGR